MINYISRIFYVNQIKTFCHTVTDADGDIVRCRWGETFTECGDVCNG